MGSETLMPLTLLLLLKGSMVLSQCGGYITQVSPSIQTYTQPCQTYCNPTQTYTTPVQTGIATSSVIQPVCQFVIPAIIKPLIASETVVETKCAIPTPIIEENSNYGGCNGFGPGYGGFPGYGGMPYPMFCGKDDDDDWRKLLIFLIFAMKNRKGDRFDGYPCGGYCSCAGCGGCGSCGGCGGCGGYGACGNCGGYGGYGKCGGCGNGCGNGCGYRNECCGGCDNNCYGYNNCNSGYYNNCGNNCRNCGTCPYCGRAYNNNYIPYPIAYPVNNAMGSSDNNSVCCTDDCSMTDRGCDSNGIDLVIWTGEPPCTSCTC